MPDCQSPSPSDRPQRVFVHAFGCQMNVYDAQRMLQSLRAEGFDESAVPEEADVILVHTCSVREGAQRKVQNALQRYATLRAAHPGLVIGITGCVAQQEGEALLAAAPAPDLVVGPDEVGRIAELVRAARTRPALAVEMRPAAGYAFDACEPQPAERPLAQLAVMKGCDAFCSYCIVPYVRGREASKPLTQVLAETERLLAAGAREVLLLGQNVNRYRDPTDPAVDFPALLEAVAALPGLGRLRFTTSHPADCTDRLIDCFGRLAPLCEYFHLPFQSGSDRVLERMRRGYTAAHYLERVAAIRRRVPDIHLSADVIVGFPGETEADFEATLALIEAARFGSLYMFKYSPRPGTRAARFADDVPDAEKARRLAAVQALQDVHSRAHLLRYVGYHVEVLVEGPSQHAGRAAAGDQWMGRTRTHDVVNFARPAGADPAAFVGALVTVRVEHAGAHSLRGRVV